MLPKECQYQNPISLYSSSQGQWQSPTQGMFHKAFSQENLSFASSRYNPFPEGRPWLSRWQSTAPDPKGIQQKMSSLVLNGKQITKNGAAGASGLIRQLPVKVRWFCPREFSRGCMKVALRHSTWKLYQSVELCCTIHWLYVYLPQFSLVSQKQQSGSWTHLEDTRRNNDSNLK